MHCAEKANQTIALIPQSPVVGCLDMFQRAHCSKFLTEFILFDRVTFCAVNLNRKRTLKVTSGF
jgi:hypothetical protein